MRALVLAVLVLGAALSAAWWRRDADVCACEYCPDGYCRYAARLGALLRGEPDALARLGDFAEHYIHAHDPLGPALHALARLAVPDSIASYMAASAAATIAAWIGVRAVARWAWQPSPGLLRWLAIAFFSHFLVVRSLLRPQTDALGMACTVWALWAAARALDEPSPRSTTRLVALELLGLTARVSFIPVLGVAPLVELTLPGSLATRVRRALRAGIAFAALPAAVYLGLAALAGVLHLGRVWSFAHREQFVAAWSLGAAALGLAVALQGYGAIGLAAPRATQRATLAFRVHATWIALYATFLVLGGGALWLRYWVPIVPSAIVLAAGALTAAERRRPIAVRALLAGFAAANLAAAWSASDAGTLARAEWARRAARAEAGVAWLGAGRLASDAHAAVDGDSDTSWLSRPRGGRDAPLELDLGGVATVRGVAIRAPDKRAPETISIAASSDGIAWRPVATGELRRGRRRFLGPEEILVDVPAVAARRLAITGRRADGGPWRAVEVEVAVATADGSATAPSEPAAAADARTPATPTR